MALQDLPRKGSCREGRRAAHACLILLRIVFVIEIPLQPNKIVAQQTFRLHAHDSEILLTRFISPVAQQEFGCEIDRPDSGIAHRETVFTEQTRLPEDAHQFRVPWIPHRPFSHVGNGQRVAETPQTVGVECFKRPNPRHVNRFCLAESRPHYYPPVNHQPCRSNVLLHHIARAEWRLVFKWPSPNFRQTADDDINAVALIQRCNCTGRQKIAHPGGNAAVHDAHNTFLHRGLVQLPRILGHERDVTTGLAGLDDCAEGGQTQPTWKRAHDQICL